MPARRAARFPFPAHGRFRSRTALWRRFEIDACAAPVGTLLGLPRRQAGGQRQPARHGGDLSPPLRHGRGARRLTGDATTFCYDLNGQVISISASRAGLWPSFDLMLGSLRVSEAVEPGFRINIVETSALPENPEGKLAFDGEIPLDGHCRIVDGRDVVHLVFPGLQTASVHADEGWAEIRVHPDGKIKWTLSMLVLDAALDAGGQHMLHTAGMTLPGSEALVLIHAPSGTGKSTTSMALASQGFGLCSDDVMILAAAPGGVTAWGMPRQVKIHRNTAAMLPFVSPCLGDTWNIEDEQAVSLERLGEIIR